MKITKGQLKVQKSDIARECEKILRELLIEHPWLIETVFLGDNQALEALNELLRNNGILKQARKDLDWGK